MPIGIAGLGGASLKGNESKVFMDKQVVFHPQDSDANSIKAKVEIEKNFIGTVLKAGFTLKGDSLMGALQREFVGEFGILVEEEEEIEDALVTLTEFHAFVNEFIITTHKALDMYPEMAKKEEGEDKILGGGASLAKMASMLKPTPKDFYGHLLTEYLEKKTLDELKEMAEKKEIDLGNVSDDKATLVFVIAKSSLESWENELPEGTDDNDAIAEFIIG